MAGHGTQRQVTNTKDMLRRMQKDTMYEARRSAPRTAADLFGPGLASHAVRTQDWNGEELAFNGLFYSEPGALNSPDVSRYWMGLVIANPDGTGIQRVWEYRAPTDPTLAPIERTRLFAAVSGVRSFGSWLNPAANNLLTTDPRVPFARAAGVQNVVAAALAVGGVNTYAVSFPTGRFTQVPIVQVTLQGAPGGSASASVRATAITTTGFSVALYNTHPTSAMTFASTPAGWHAEQALSGSASD